MSDWWKARGWAEIAEVLHLSVSTAKRLMVNQGLPVKWEGGQWTLTKEAYMEWHKGLPGYREKQKMGNI